MKTIAIWVIFYLLFGVTSVFAQGGESGIGGIAANALNPVGLLTEFFEKASLIIGISFIFGSFIRYLQYRKNPLAVPLSNVITLLILGVVLVFLPLTYKLTSDEPPYVVESTQTK